MKKNIVVLIVLLSITVFLLFVSAKMSGIFELAMSGIWGKAFGGILLLMFCILFLLIIYYQPKHEKNTEISLSDNDEHFITIASPADIPVFIISRESYELAYINSAFATLLGVHNEDVIGKTPLELNWCDYEYFHSKIKNIFNNCGKVKNMEIEIDSHNGTKHAVLSSDKIMFDNKEFCIGTLHNVKESEKRRSATDGPDTQDSNIITSNFATIASHEFRTLLTTILSSASLLEIYKTSEQQSDRLRHIERIRSSSANLIMILDEFVALDKIESGAISAKLRKFDIEEFIHILCVDLKHMAGKEQVIEYAHRGEKYVVCDSSFIRHILTNLISNSLKYSPEGTVISVFSSYEYEKLQLRVKAADINIDLDKEQGLFKSFYKAYKVDATPGIGLGLHITKHYVDMLGGTITLQSSDIGGIEFIVEI